MSASALSRSPRQTTVLLGGSNGTKTLCSILGDQSNPTNRNHTVRVVTRNPSNFIDAETNSPQSWRCEEQKAWTDVCPSSWLPTTWITHVGSPSTVLGYNNDNDGPSTNSSSSLEYNSIERAISGIGCDDDGGVADVIVLCCPVYAHLDILKMIAKALYRLDADGCLLRRNAPPMLIGTLYAAGGFDWMCRIAFASTKPPSFSGTWSRDLALFGLRSFPYLCKSLEKGKVTLYGRYPQLNAALSPSTPRVRMHAKQMLDRVLQCDVSGGKSLNFVGLSASEKLGGDGSAVLFDNVASFAATATAAATTSSSVTTKSDKPERHIMDGTSLPPIHRNPQQQQAQDTTSLLMSDLADPYSSLGFLGCTLMATNQVLHPCIIKALFEKEDENGVGYIDDWDNSKPTKLPRFYGDGAAKPEAGRLIVNISVGEYYPLLCLLDRVLSPNGLQPISSQHGGEPVGRFLLTQTGNHPNEVAQRTGIFNRIINKNTAISPPNDKVKFGSLFRWGMSYGLSRNTRLQAVLSPMIKDKDTGRLTPNVNTRFFIDDVPHGLCIALGLGEILGFDLERDMTETLELVRTMQRWMGKEYVLPKEGSSGGKTVGGGRGIVSGARDLNETSAPQSFGVYNIHDLREFLNSSPFGDDSKRRMDMKLSHSVMMMKMNNMQQQHHHDDKPKKEVMIRAKL